jgi:5-methyltetrahydrofolate--homocysteine methyltransferase
MEQKVILLDGATGTSLWKKASDKQPVWKYNIENPEIVVELEKEYIAAGSQIIETNTFAANRSFVSRESNYSVARVVQAAVRLSHQAVEGTNVKVMLDVGPIMEMMEPYGPVSEAEVRDIYQEQISAGMECEYKPDGIFLMTFIDLAMAEIAISVAEQYNVPIFVSMSFSEEGYTIMGNSVEDFANAMNQHPLVQAIGLNCNLTPAKAAKVLAQLAEKTDKELIFKPNAGQPKVVNGVTISGENAATFVEESLQALPLGVKYMGGCCGTDPSYISLLREELEKM